MGRKNSAVRADGLYQKQIELGRDENGKRRRRTIYAHTQKELDEKAMSLKVSMGKGIDISNHETFADWSKRWLDGQRNNVSVKWLKECAHIVEQLNELIGFLDIAKVRPADIQRVIDELAEENPHTGRPSSKHTLSVYKNVASGVMGLAVMNRVIDFNPAAAVRIPDRAPKETRRALTDEERRRIEETPHRAQTAALIMLYAGLRRGELIPLTWEDIDFERRCIRIDKSVEAVSNTFNVKSGGKTSAATRNVIIPDVLCAHLAAQPRTSTYVCPNARGERHTLTSWRKLWDTYMGELNRQYGVQSPELSSNKYAPIKRPMSIERITPHMLRHTYASVLYRSGVDVMTAKEQMGHSNISVTLGIYTHLDAEYKTGNIAKLNEFLSNGSKG
ncbi:MAG: site-specific integrase [Oscillospiraceae bacterium]|jgi:integrase|nr:site-specific integrase [Oscillospiraceae bacterium]